MSICSREREIAIEILTLIKRVIASQDNNLIDSLVKRIGLLCQILISTTRNDKIITSVLQIKAIFGSTSLLKLSNYSDASYLTAGIIEEEVTDAIT